MSQNEEISIACHAVARAVKEAKFVNQYPFGSRRARRHAQLASNAVDMLCNPITRAVLEMEGGAQSRSERAAIILGNVCQRVYDALNDVMYRAESAHLN